MQRPFQLKVCCNRNAIHMEYITKREVLHNITLPDPTSLSCLSLFQVACYPPKWFYQWRGQPTEEVVAIHRVIWSQTQSLSLVPKFKDTTPLSQKPTISPQSSNS